MHNVRWLFILRVALFVALGQGVSNQPRVPGAEKVSGVVTSRTTGGPIAGATVTLRPTVAGLVARTAVTDTVGHFEIADIVPGPYRVAGEKSGFVNQDLGSKRPSEFGTIFTLTSKQVVSELIVSLTPKGVIAGKVSGEDGGPLPGFSVQAFNYQFVRGFRQLELEGTSSVTNDLGEYRVANVTPGNYFVVVTPPRTVTLTAVGSDLASTNYSMNFFPSGQDFNAASRVAVRPGTDTAGTNFALRKTPALHIRGEVSSAVTGKHVRFCNVIAYPKMSGILFPTQAGSFAVNDPDGRFDIADLPPGSYVLMARLADSRGLMSVASVVDLNQEDLENVRIQFGAGNLNVSVRLPPGSDQSGSESAAPQLGGKAVTASSEKSSGDGAPPNDAGPPRLDFSRVTVGVAFDDLPAVTIASGKFSNEGTAVLSDLSAQRYRVSVAGLPPGWYLKGASVGGQDVLTAGFSFSGSSVPLELTLDTSAGKVSGTVLGRDGKGASRARVTLVPSARPLRLDLRRLAVTEDDGSFVVNSVAPGDYEVYAWADLSYPIPFDPSFLASFRRVKVTVDENTTRSAELKAITPEEAEDAERRLR